MLLVGLGVWRLSDSLQWSRNSTVRYALPAAVLGVFGWICYRLINQARFADFLIATEAEMNKVSWPSWPELRRTTAVVLITMLILAVVLFCYDVVWQQLLTAVGVLRKPD
ncbi:MAG: preprotein translocase subunit SecE [Planctomycetes bacterium]|nr:preprotein translocase subunit SecE [Planctomycetota bacterium]